MSQNQYTMIGKGTIYIGVDESNLLPIGDVSSAQLTWEEDEKSLPDSQNAGGGKLKSVKRVTGAKLALKAHDLSPSNLAIALRADNTSYAGGAITAEAHSNIVIGALVKLDHIPDTSVAYVVKKGATTLSADDYTVTDSGLLPLSTGTNTLADGDDLTVDYTALGDDTLELLVNSSTSYYIFLEGLNEAESGRPHHLDVYKAVPNMSPVDFIADDFAGLDLTFDLNKDTTKTGTGISQYAKWKLAKAV